MHAKKAGTAKPSPQVESTAAAAKLAVQRHKAGDLATAERLYGHVLLVEPNNPQCLHNLATIWLKRNDLRAALDLLEAAVRADARRPLFHCTLGTARLQAGDAEGAAAAFQHAIDLQAGNSPAWDGLGMALRKLERFDEAIKAQRRALKLDPDSRAAARNLGLTLIDVGELEEAELIYDRLLQASPLDPDVAIQRGIIRLTRGDNRGWNEYAWNHWSPEWLKTDPPVLVPLPQWDGEALRDRGLMLYGEQGIGDEIMFAAFAQAAAARADRTVLLCEPRLVALFGRSFPAIAVAAKPVGGEPPLLGPDTGCHMRCSLSRLPGTLGVQREDFNGSAYLRADRPAVDRWRQRLAALGDGLKVGISWRGGNNDLTRATRSLALESFASLFEIPDVHFINVQYGNRAEEIAAFNQHATRPLNCFEDVDPLRDMDGLAALLCALDLVISVDNSTVHLAGALGVPTWMLCPFNANWRWTQEGSSSHWYQSVRLFRQEASRRAAWEPVVEHVAAALRDAIASPAPHSSLSTSTPVTPAGATLAAAPSVMLINDSAYWYHWGSTATSLGLHQALRSTGHVVDSVPTAILAQIGPLPASAVELEDESLFQRFSQRNASILRRMQAVSEVIVNGGECMHGLGQLPRALLYLAWIARRRFGKRTSIINHSCFPSLAVSGDLVADTFYSQVYAAMDHVAVRESQSVAHLARLGIHAVSSFDCLPLFVDAHRPELAPQREKRVVLCGGPQGPAMAPMLEDIANLALKRGFAVDVLVGASAFFAQDDLQLVAALHPRLRGRYRLVAATSERQWLEVLSGAALLVSARFHHSAAAAFLGTPFAVTPGNTPDIEGLIDVLGLRRDAVLIPTADMERAAAVAAALLQDPQPALVAAERLEALRALTLQNFAGLNARVS